MRGRQAEIDDYMEVGEPMEVARENARIYEKLLTSFEFL